MTRAANGPPHYAVNLVWGDKSGLPTARPYPAARTKTDHRSPRRPAAPTARARSAVDATCVGGDFDGDGHSDILLGDLFYTPPGGGAQTGHHVLFYGQARADATAPVVIDFTAAPATPSVATRRSSAIGTATGSSTSPSSSRTCRPGGRRRKRTSTSGAAPSRAPVGRRRRLPGVGDLSVQRTVAASASAPSPAPTDPAARRRIRSSGSTAASPPTAPSRPPPARPRRAACASTARASRSTVS